MKAGVAETLQEVVELVTAGATHGIAFGNFLAFLNPEALQEAIREVPPPLAGRHPSRAMLDALYAAAAEFLARKRWPAHSLLDGRTGPVPGGLALPKQEPAPE